MGVLSFKTVEKKITKTFDYTVGDTNLTFTLRVDTKSQLTNYEHLLTLALKDVQDELAKQN